MTTKVPAELSSTPSISDSGNATAIVIDSSENVAIGASSTSTKVTIQAADSDTVNSSANGHLTFYDDAPFGYYKIRIATTNRDLAFDGYDTDNSWKEILKLDRVDQRINAKGGIMFGSDTASANTLDDYEEGTWTPATYSGTVATATGTARYHKIGGLVVASCRLNTFSDTSGSDHVRITGLPFRIVTPANKNCGYAWSNEATVYFYGQPNETQVWLYHNGSSGFQDVSYSELSSSTQYMCLFTYFTDQ